MEPFIFLGCIILFFLPIVARKYLEYLQVLAGFALVSGLMIFHEDIQIRILFTLALVWGFGSISALSINQKRNS